MMRDIKVQILRLLSETDCWLTPNNIAENIGYTNSYVGTYCKQLKKDGFVERKSDAGDPFYRITKDGREKIENGAAAAGAS